MVQANFLILLNISLNNVEFDYIDVILKEFVATETRFSCHYFYFRRKKETVDSNKFFLIIKLYHI